MAEATSNRRTQKNKSKSSDKQKTCEFEAYDWRALHEGRQVIGIDEVGRGCLAGPVYAAAVLMGPSDSIDGLTDSKKISETRRSHFSKLIKEQLPYGIGFASIEEIDEINILQASFLAMRRAIENLQKVVALSSPIVLVDGHQKIPKLAESFEQITLVKGDLRAEPVSAASIIAKVARDTLLIELDEEVPAYQFKKNKGYGTKDHREAIALHGPSTYHRRSFAGVREHL